MTESNRFQHSDAIEAAWQFTEQVPHGRDLGMRVVRVEGNQAIIDLSPQPWMFADDDCEEICTSILYSLADSACGLAVFAEAPELTPIATLDLRMDYLRPAAGDRDLLAVATCLHLTEEIAFIHCDILSNGDSQPVATGSGTFVRNTDGQRFQAAAGEK
ncbi:PaaI family thioesterase [Pseudomonas veronii]|uniref:PaaI family thioesterase n=1 Tax=Pseudomonas veronii TaxID=76761 RepID=A0A7Y1FBK8_PSEVE|nr:PaaI family thioesterase [Pseudomonas veronii]NMY11914.1 PaaI family thioesterase [Pseudomonas veronii]